MNLRNLPEIINMRTIKSKEYFIDFYLTLCPPDRRVIRKVNQMIDAILPNDTDCMSLLEFEKRFSEEVRKL